MEFGGQKLRGSLEQYVASHIHIEHILPQNPRDDLRSSWEEEHPDQPYDEIRNRLGNLTLIEKTLNVVASNNFYDEKKPLYAKSKYYLTQSLSGLADVGQNTSITRINEKLHPFEKWDMNAIEERQSMLTNLAFDIWKTTEIT